MSGYEINIRTTTDLKIDDSADKIHDEKEKEEANESKVEFFKLFRFATTVDIVLIVVGTICAMALGTTLPSFAILWGDITNSLGGGGDIVAAGRKVLYNFFEIGAGAFVVGFGMVSCWMISGERQSIACRKVYLRSLLKQEIGWFDTINQSELAAKFSTDCLAFQGAIGEKVGTLIMTISMGFVGFIIAFLHGWMMTLIVAVSLPFIAIGGIIFATAAGNKDKAQQK